MSNPAPNELKDEASENHARKIMAINLGNEWHKNPDPRHAEWCSRGSGANTLARIGTRRQRQRSEDSHKNQEIKKKVKYKK